MKANHITRVIAVGGILCLLLAACNSDHITSSNEIAGPNVTTSPQDDFSGPSLAVQYESDYLDPNEDIGTMNWGVLPPNSPNHFSLIDDRVAVDGGSVYSTLGAFGSDRYGFTDLPFVQGEVAVTEVRIGTRLNVELRGKTSTTYIVEAYIDGVSVGWRQFYFYADFDGIRVYKIPNLGLLTRDEISTLEVKITGNFSGAWVQVHGLWATIEYTVNTGDPHVDPNDPTTPGPER